MKINRDLGVTRKTARFMRQRIRERFLISWLVALSSVALVACGDGGIGDEAPGEAVGTAVSANGTVASDPPPLFVAVGSGVMTSSDGTTWTEQEDSLVLTAVAHGGGRVVALGPEGYVVVTTDGARWTMVDPGDGLLMGAVDVAFGDDRFIAVGEYLRSDLGSGAIVATSRDGLDWSPIDHVIPGRLRAITYGGRKFVAVGTNLVATSADGISWNTSPFEAPRQLFGIGYGDGTFVITGGLSSIFSSLDGVDWMSRESGAPEQTFLRGVTHGNGLFVAVGDRYDAAEKQSRSSIITSPDGVNWTLVYSGEAQSLSDVAYGNASFVVVGQSETYGEYGVTDTAAIALTSQDGNEWEFTEITGGGKWLSGVTFWQAPE